MVVSWQAQDQPNLVPAVKSGAQFGQVLDWHIKARDLAHFAAQFYDPPVGSEHQRAGHLLPGSHCLQTMSIRIGQAVLSVHFRPSRSNAFAITIGLRMIAVMANFLYFSFISGLKRVAATAGR